MIHLPIPAERLNDKSISDRFWGTNPKQNYFARAKNIVLSGKLDRKLLLQVQEEYDGNLVTDFALQWRELLEEITFQIALDEKIDADERAFFKEYISIFQIPNDEASRIYRTGARRALMSILAGLVEDWELSKADIKHIEQVSKNFGLGHFEVESSIKEHLRFQVNARIVDMLDDDLISDDEWNEFIEYCDSLNIELSISPDTNDQIEQARRHWRLQFGKLLPIDEVPVKLKPSEQAYFVGYAKWYENRKSKGETILKKICQGQLVLTDQRVLILADYEDNRSVSWSSVIAVNRLSSRKFELEKARGKSPEIHVIKAPNHMLKTASLIANRLFEG